jgi:hypothetical protein
MSAQTISVRNGVRIPRHRDRPFRRIVITDYLWIKKPIMERALSGHALCSHPWSHRHLSQ